MRDMETAPGTLQREPERNLVTWTAPARPFKRRDRQFYVTTFAIAGIVSLVLFLAEGVMPVILIISLVFLYYVLSTVEPENIEYKATTRGIKIAVLWWSRLVADGRGLLTLVSQGTREFESHLHRIGGWAGR